MTSDSNISENKLMKPFALTVLWVLFCYPSFAAEPLRPNIIFILADDMGWADMRCQGHPYAKTPNLDKLASEGTRFTQCYATGVTCCPSRTGFMTGKFPATFAKYPASSGFGDRITITELLHKKGYATGHFGKWHIGPKTDHGTYGIDSIGIAENESRSKKNRESVASVRGRDAKIYDQAIRFIEQHKEGPFYINIWDHVPHHPVNPSQSLIESFGMLEVDESKFSEPMREKFARCKQLGGDVSTHMRAFLAEINAMDAEIGSLLRMIDKLGLRENTIIVFSSDQGPADIRVSNSERTERSGSNNTVDIRLNAMGFAGPFRGGKHDQHEGGVRIPWIVRWPGYVSAGRVDEDSVISGADWLPTLCAITNININKEELDGEDASAAWFANKFTRTKPLMWKTSSTGSQPAIRMDNWKFYDNNRRKGKVELYDLANDPGETVNLAATKPDLVELLSDRLSSWMETLPKNYDKSDEVDD